MKRYRKTSECWPELTGAGDPRFVRQGAARLVTGGSSTARADMLAASVADAVRSGARPEDVLVLCADPSGAARMRRKLEALAGPAVSAGAAGASTGPTVSAVPVMTCRELACEVLAQPEATSTCDVAFTGGRARILGAYEVDFVTEDVKTLGTRPGRLREMLKFLYRGWTELSDEDPEWLFTVEEIDTFAFLNDELRYLGAVMEPQVSNLAAKALRLDAGLRGRFARRRVFALDYQNLSRASQLMCQLVALDELQAYADPTACAEVHESYPHLEGVAEFARLNPAAQAVNMDDEAVAACFPSPAPLRRELVWATPQDEVKGVAEEIAAAIADGRAPEDVAVMAPHPWWAQSIGRALERRGVAANVWFAPLRLRGDVRELDRCLALRTVTLLRLLADPHDGAAWRSWFGFGDYLTRSNLFCSMRRDEETTGDVRRDLEAFGYDLGTDLDPLFAECRNLRGPELLGHLVRTLAGPDAELPAALRPLCALGTDADAAAMVAELDRRQFFSGVPDRPGVTVSSFSALADLDFPQVYAVGFVNGLFPSAAYFDLTRVSVNRQAKMGEQDARTARGMARLARETLTVSRFEQAEHAFAERTGIKQERVFAESDEGGMLAEVSPSIYTDVLMGRA